MTGHVTLLGAGPGDPDLITRRGLKRLAEATLVFYDALVSPELLQEAPQARRLYVGKRAGRHAMSQRTIERLMVRFARRGERVVRLKCGDPFVFGRGGEEALALRKARVPFDVVPGVSAALAAPQAAGIPVTHRGVSAGFLVTTGHDPHRFGEQIQGTSSAAFSLVILMGYRQRAALASKLVNAGYSEEMPVALISGATFDNQCIVRTTLQDLGEACVPDERAVTIVVGDVVNLEVALDATRDLEDSVAAHGGSV